MSYLVSVQSLFVRLIERAREWSQRSIGIDSAKRKKDDNDLYDFFLFGPHG